MDADATILCPDMPYIEAVRSQLGAIDLDPCSSYRAQVAIAAQHWISAEQAPAALAEPWIGRVFLHLHPSLPMARRQVHKLLRDYLAGRVPCALILSDYPDLLRSEPLLLSFPFLHHLRRIRYWRWDPQQEKQVSHFHSRYSVTHYLPRRDVSHFNDEDINTFVRRFSRWGRVVIAEDLGDDWQQDVLRATHRWQQQPLLTATRIQRHED